MSSLANEIYSMSEISRWSKEYTRQNAAGECRNQISTLIACKACTLSTELEWDDIPRFLRQPRTEMGAQRWQHWILPLNHCHFNLASISW